MFKTNKPTLFKMSVEVSGYVLELRNVDEHYYCKNKQQKQKKKYMKPANMATSRRMCATDVKIAGVKFH